MQIPAQVVRKYIGQARGVLPEGTPSFVPPLWPGLIAVTALQWLLSSVCLHLMLGPLETDHRKT